MSCSLAVLAACGSDETLVPRGPIDDLVDDYEDGVITRDQFRAAIAAEEDTEIPNQLTEDIAVSTVLKARPEPYRIDSELDVVAGAILVIEQGAEIVIGPEANVNVRGRLYAMGADGAPVAVSAEPGGHYGAVILHSGPNQVIFTHFDRGTRALSVDHPFDTHTRVEDARFDSWNDVAIDQVASSGLHVLRSRFGFDSSDADASRETIRTRNSGVIVIEESEFSRRRGYRDVLDLQYCVEGYWPVVIRNTFHGGEDDAVDLDQCSAFVIGNHISNFRPEDLNAMVLGVNGGGVTGDAGSRPVIINNVIDGCYHAIGFKDGSQPVIINNTITNSNIGVTLYQSSVEATQPSGIMVNNVLWNNVGWLSGEPQEIELNGKWWPSYNQVDDVQATLDARYNTTATLAAPYPGEGNLTSDPRIEFVDGVPMLSAGSPAIDSGLGDLSLEGTPMEEVIEYLSTDYLGNQRDSASGVFASIDRGAVEFVP